MRRNALYITGGLMALFLIGYAITASSAYRNADRDLSTATLTYDKGIALIGQARQSYCTAYGKFKGLCFSGNTQACDKADSIQQQYSMQYSADPDTDCRGTVIAKDPLFFGDDVRSK